MNEHIIQFINKQTCATVCGVDEQGNPYCFSCFYAFDSNNGVVYFKSSAATRHSDILANNPNIAATILPDKLNTLMVKGIQFEGTVLHEAHPFAKAAAKYYYKKHPAAVAMPGELWAIEIHHIKMTDSTLGFGKKINWNRSEAVTEQLQ
jgi:uncharacterized protein